MQASRPINLPIPATQNSKESRSYLLVGPEEAFLGNGNTQFRISSQILMSDVIQAALTQGSSLLEAAELRKKGLDTEESKLSQMTTNRSKTGLFEIQADYASSQKQLVFDVHAFTQAENPKKVQGRTECFHSCRYKISSTDSASTAGAGTTAKSCTLSRKDLFQMCLDLLKKIQNLNCADKFFQDTSTLNTNDSGSREFKKLQFEASSMNICPMDFSRVLIQINQEANQDMRVALSILLPNTRFKIRAIPQMKMVSTPLSRLLLGKLN